MHAACAASAAPDIARRRDLRRGPAADLHPTGDAVINPTADVGPAVRTYSDHVTTAESPAPPAALAELRSSRAAYLRLQRLLRLLAPVCVVALTLVGLRSSSHDAGRTVVTAALIGFGVGAAGALLTRGRPRRLHALFLALLLLASGTLIVTEPSGVGAFGVVVAVVLSPWRPRGRLGLTVLGGAGAAVLVGVAVAGRASVVSGLFTGVSLACIATVNYLARRLGAANAVAEQLVHDLETSRVRELRLAAVAERQSLARELHDVLAHSLSGLLLQLEGARVLATEAPDDPRLAVAVERAHHLAKAGLDEAREAIAVLRDDDALPGPDELPALVGRFRTTSGLPCELEVTGASRPLAADVRLGVYRVAQEALTNIAKHAAASRATVRLDYDADEVRLVVEDTSDAAPSASPAHGYGLSGMGERADLLGGRLRAAPTPSGFRVELVVPG